MELEMNKATWGALALLAAAAVPAQATDVGVSVSVNQPGLYGRIDIGRVPSPPVLVYPQPVIIAQPAVAVQRQPIYLHVPPGHAKDWRKHCGKYNACGQPVYFVQESWYEQNYAGGRGEGKQKHGKGHGKGHGKHDN
jgi:hypothetical protein